ncbi:MAG: peptidylprolyl isomerase [Planctomycetota bacterium]|nr:peptidylprolyl isomerase [Planctomycetota bacterium]
MRNRYVVIALLVVAAAYIVIAANPPGDKSAEAQPAAALAGADAASPQAADSGDVSKEKKQYPKPPEMKIDKEKTYTATIETDAGTMVAELYPKLAPQTVNSFVFLAREGFYEGVIFHRVIPGFMIQGGDPTGTGSGGPGYSVPAEFNDTKHERGILSMARSQDVNSAGSQFFVMHDTYPSLDGKYTVFGKLTKGVETVDKIVTAPTGANDRPTNPVKIKKITIDEK